MKTIDCRKPLLSLKGESLKDDLGEETTVGKVLANVMITHRGGKVGPMKGWNLAQNFFNKESVELDDADFRSVLDILLADQNYFPLVIGQVEQYLTGLA